MHQCNCFELLTYFIENWHNCKTLWCLAYHRDLLTLGNNTNRIENFNRQLKRALQSNLHLCEALEHLVNGNYASSSDIGYGHKRELGMRVDTHCNTLPNLFKKFETLKHSLPEVWILSRKSMMISYILSANYLLILSVLSIVTIICHVAMFSAPDNSSPCFIVT